MTSIGLGVFGGRGGEGGKGHEGARAAEREREFNEELDAAHSESASLGVQLANLKAALHHQERMMIELRRSPAPRNAASYTDASRIHVSLAESHRQIADRLSHALRRHRFVVSEPVALCLNTGSINHSPGVSRQSAHRAAWAQERTAC